MKTILINWLKYRWHRTSNKILHRYGLHHAPMKTLLNGDQYRWCKWCGLRESYKNPNPTERDMSELCTRTKKKRI